MSNLDNDANDRAGLAGPVSYLAGTWFGIFGDNATVLLPPSEKRRVGSLWELVDDGAGFDEVLDGLVSAGLRDLPGFVLISELAGATKVVLRGAARARFVSGSDVVEVEGAEGTTWVERSIAGVSEVVIEVEDTADPMELTIGSGLVRVARVACPPGARGEVAEVPAHEPATEPPAAAALAGAGEPGQGGEDVPPGDEDSSPGQHLAEEPGPTPYGEPQPDADAPVEQPTFGEPAGSEADVADTDPGLPTQAMDLPAEEQAPAADTPAPGWPAPEGDPLGQQPDQWQPPSVPAPPAAPPFGQPSYEPSYGEPLAPPPYAEQPGEPSPASGHQPPQEPAWGQPQPPPHQPAEGGESWFGQGQPAPADHDGLTRAGAWDPSEFARQQPGIPGQPPAPSVTSRPVARLVISSGETVDVDRAILIGRAPEARRFTSADQPRLVTVHSPNQEISSTHVEVRPGSGADHGTAVVTDMGSTNGTVLVQPGLQPEELQPGIAVQLIPGAIIDLGDGLTIQVTNAG